jgi:hypothetical protein
MPPRDGKKKRAKGKRAVADVVTISSNPWLGSAETLAALRGVGLDAEHLADEAGRSEVIDEGAAVLVFGVNDAPPDLAHCVLLALEQIVADAHTPLVPEMAGPHSFLVRPPAG